MKINIFLSLIAVLLSLLVGYLAYDIAEGDNNSVLCGIFSSVCFIATMTPMIGFCYDNARLGVNMRVLSLLFFVSFVVSHLSFASFGVKMPYYIIVNGLLLLIFMAILYKLSRVQKL